MSESKLSNKSKPGSQNQNPPAQKPVAPKSNQPWTFGYPQCQNKKESRLVCLHSQCEKYPFFCSSCQDQSCQNEHQHQDRITSIGFKQLIKRLISERKPPEDLQRAVREYKKELEELLKNVTEFVKKENESMDEVLKKSTQLEEEDEKVVARLKDKKYQEIKGKELDKVWKKIVPNEEKKKMEKETIEFIDSKKVEVQEMTNNFRDGIQVENKPQQKPTNPSKNPSQQSNNTSTKK